MGLTRRSAITGVLATGLFFTNGASALPRVSRPDGVSPWTLWYRAPATYWVEALPIGTGRFGAMVFGDPHEERLQLNEDTFWGGGPYDPSDPAAREKLTKVRDLIFRGDYAAAQKLAHEAMMAKPIRQMSYQTLGGLRFGLPLDGEITQYRRWLDLKTSEVCASWRADGRNYKRTAFASAEDQIIVLRQTVEEGPVELVLSADDGEISYTDEIFWKRGHNLAQHGVEGKLRYTIGIAAQGPNLSRAFDGARLRLSADREITLIISGATNYKNWRDVSGDENESVRATLAQAGGRSIGDLKERHTSAHAQLFDGFDIDLGPDPFPEASTDERIRFSHERGHDDPYLAALYVQYARYLLLASSRPGSQPANLQGIWNDSNSPPWGSKYTININTQMNYWPAERLGLAPCVEPLIAMIEDLAESGRRTAKINYGARGWVVHHNTDIWRATAPIDSAFYGMWPMGGAWLCQHLWDRYDYSRNLDVLRRVYPLMRDCGLFYLDTLVEHPGGDGLVTAPSISPENAHHPGVSICAGPAVDRQILRELFGNIIAGAEILGVDQALQAEFTAVRSRLPADRVGKAGQLQEWLEDWDMDVVDIQHRHVSHLYAVYPGHEIGPETPALYEAARRSLAIRGDDATGWGIGWRINLWARLGDGARAYAVLRKLLGPDRTYPNMFDAHPPFQIDGNFGGGAGIIEMLVRDRPEELHLLPALPAKIWPAGALKNVQLRGAMRMDLCWREGKLLYADIVSRDDADRKLRYGDDIRTVRLQSGRTARVTF